MSFQARFNLQPGEHVGKFVVLRLATRLESRKRAYWFRCACGAERLVQTGIIDQVAFAPTCMCEAYAVRHAIGGEDRVALFWAIVEKTEGCWFFRQSPDDRGYGRFRIDGKEAVRAHRVSWFLTHGEWPALCVLHTCDNPPCVRPDHLFLGTHADNNADMRAKDRHSRGERRSQAKLTDDAVREIRLAYARGDVSQRELGRRFSVDQSIVSEVVNGKRWRHVQ